MTPFDINFDCLFLKRLPGTENYSFRVNFQLGIGKRPCEKIFTVNHERQNIKMLIDANPNDIFDDMAKEIQLQVFTIEFADTSFFVDFCRLMGIEKREAMKAAYELFEFPNRTMVACALTGNIIGDKLIYPEPFRGYAK